jgi:GMP synthase-like glutamine amidotransferase
MSCELGPSESISQQLDNHSIIEDNSDIFGLTTLGTSSVRTSQPLFAKPTIKYLKVRNDPAILAEAEHIIGVCYGHKLPDCRQESLGLA